MYYRNQIKNKKLFYFSIENIFCKVHFLLNTLYRFDKREDVESVMIWAMEIIKQLKPSIFRKINNWLYTYFEHGTQSVETYIRVFFSPFLYSCCHCATLFRSELAPPASLEPQFAHTAHSWQCHLPCGTRRKPTQ